MGGDTLLIQSMVIPSDVPFLFDKKFQPMIASPQKYSKAQLLNACLEFRDYLDKNSRPE